jgi:hypothetical protein
VEERPGPGGHVPDRLPAARPERRVPRAHLRQLLGPAAGDLRRREPGPRAEVALAQPRVVPRLDAERCGHGARRLARAAEIARHDRLDALPRQRLRQRLRLRPAASGEARVCVPLPEPHRVPGALGVPDQPELAPERRRHAGRARGISRPIAIRSW